MLNPKIFEESSTVFGKPNIDLFASRINRQVSSYVAWKPEPEAFAIDAFSIKWDFDLNYAFPPFNMIGRTIAKAEREKANMILIVPDWPTQVWFPQAMKLSDNKLYFAPHKNNLILPHREEAVHPMAKKLRMVAINCKQKTSSKHR